MLDNKGEAKKALVLLAIEKSLLTFGEPVYEKVTYNLKNEYNCYLSDCYAHPEYLSEILKKLYGDVHRQIIKSINKELEEFSYAEPVEKFLEVINR